MDAGQHARARADRQIGGYAGGNQGRDDEDDRQESKPALPRRHIPGWPTGTGTAPRPDEHGAAQPPPWSGAQGQHHAPDHDVPVPAPDGSPPGTPPAPVQPAAPDRSASFAPEPTEALGSAPEPGTALVTAPAESGAPRRPGSAGEHEIQRRWGTTERADRFYDDQMLDHLNERMREFVQRQEMFFLATADRRGECDSTFRAGPPGFLRVLDERTLVYPEYRGNGVHASLGNLQENPHLGILLMDFQQARIGLHINGRAELVEDADLRAEHPGLPDDPVPGRQAQVWVRVRVEEAYIHCAKHIPHLQKAPGHSAREWGTDNYKRKGGDFFGTAREARRRRAEAGTDTVGSETAPLSTASESTEPPFVPEPGPAPVRPSEPGPGPTRPAAARSDPSRPDTSRPDPSRPDTSRPDPSRPETSRPDPSRPGSGPLAAPRSPRQPRRYADPAYRPSVPAPRSAPPAPDPAPEPPATRTPLAPAGPEAPAVQNTEPVNHPRADEEPEASARSVPSGPTVPVAALTGEPNSLVWVREAQRALDDAQRRGDAAVREEGSFHGWFG